MIYSISSVHWYLVVVVVVVVALLCGHTGAQVARLYPTTSVATGALYAHRATQCQEQDYVNSIIRNLKYYFYTPIHRRLYKMEDK